jgi:hypothetical protein
MDAGSARPELPANRESRFKDRLSRFETYCLRLYSPDIQKAANPLCTIRYARGAVVSASHF